MVRAGLVPGVRATADEGLNRKAGSLLLLVGKEWELITISTLKEGKFSRGGGEGVISIFCPKGVFRLGSRVVGSQTARGSFQVLVLSLRLPVGLGMKARGQTD